MKRIQKIMTTVATACLMVGNVLAQEPINELTIIENVYNRAQPQDQQGVLTMSLINSRNEERVREIRQFIKDRSNG